MKPNLKQELIDKISSTDDEDILYILNEDFEYYTSNKNSLQVLENITPTQKEELIALFSKPFGEDTESYEDFKKATARWRTK